METKYEFTEKDKERMARTAKEIAEGSQSWKDLKWGTINLLNNHRKTYMHYFADREVAVTCEILLQTGHCNSDSACERCEMTAALLRAHAEIAKGARKVNRHCRTVTTVKKNGDIVITQYM